MILSWVASCIGIIANFCTARKNPIAPVLWLIATGLLFIISIIKKDWSNAFLFGINEIINYYMFIKWKKSDINS
jgi:hypothetical protein